METDVTDRDELIAAVEAARGGAEQDLARTKANLDDILLVEAREILTRHPDETEAWALLAEQFDGVIADPEARVGVAGALAAALLRIVALTDTPQ